jgi:carboxypeptidase T
MPSISANKRHILSAPLALLLLGTLVSPLAAASDFPSGYTGHHTYAELVAELRAVASAHPAITRLQSLGKTYEGRKLYVLKVSDNVGVDEGEPEVYVDGGVHANEHLSSEQALALVHWLADDYGSDPRTTGIVDSNEVWIAPMLNPDGAMYDISGGSFHRWRKNRQPTSGTPNVGVDPNRNFAYKWGCCPGSSADPGSNFYRGSAAWTTRESNAVRDFVRSRVVGGVQQIRLALTLHSHGEFVMYPFGWTSRQPWPMTTKKLSAFQVLANGIATRNGYRALQAGDLYLSNGTFMDWAYGRQHILALTLELAPLSRVNDGWYVRDAEREAEIQRNRDAVLWFLEQAGAV